MQWTDEAVILGVRRHGENSVIAEVMTRERGRHLGLIRSGRSRTIQPVLQPGNKVEVTWRARLDEHLGEFRVEPLHLRAAQLMETATAVYGVQAMAALLRLLPERDPHPEMYGMLGQLLETLAGSEDWQRTYIDFEHLLLIELGYGLDLSECASTGTRENLIYVSPKSGRAVSADAGEPYKDKLLKLPRFLLQQVQLATIEDLIDSLKITGYFLEKHREQIAHRPLPSARARLMEILI